MRKRRRRRNISDRRRRFSHFGLGLVGLVLFLDHRAELVYLIHVNASILLYEHRIELIEEEYEEFVENRAQRLIVLAC